MQISHQSIDQNELAQQQSLEIFDTQHEYLCESSQEENQSMIDIQQYKNRCNPTTISQSQEYKVNAQNEDSYYEQSSKQLTIITQLEQFSKSITQYAPSFSSYSHNSTYQPPWMSRTVQQEDKLSQCSSIMDFQAKIQIYNEMKVSKIFNQWKLLVYKPILINHNNQPHNAHNIKQGNNSRKIKINNNVNQNSNKQNIKIQREKIGKLKVIITSKKYDKQIQKEQQVIKSSIKLKFECFNAWKIEIKYKKAKEYYNKKIFRLFFITCSYLLQIRLRSIYLEEILKISRLPNVLNHLILNQKRNIAKVQKIIKKSVLSTWFNKFKRDSIDRATNKLAKLMYELQIKKKYWKAFLSLSKS